jgi:HSP20 family molecular chaperone IbpA
VQNPFESIQQLAEQMNWVNQIFGPEAMGQMRDSMKAMKEPGERSRRPAPPPAGSQPAGPPLEIYLTPDAVVLCAILPGLTAPEQVRLSLLGPKELLLEAYLPARSLDGAVLHQERFTGYCHRIVSLPVAILAEGGTAALSDGILECRFPRQDHDGETGGVAVLQVHQP